MHARLTTVCSVAAVCGALIAYTLLAQTPPTVGNVDERAAKMVEDSLIPIGGVIAFWGTRDAVDRLSNYEICDGNRVSKPDSPIVGVPKPNLKDRFIMGIVNATNVTSPEILGGANEITERTLAAERTSDHALSIEEMPAHDHGGKTGTGVGRITISDPGLLVRHTKHFGAKDSGNAAHFDSRAGQCITPMLPDHSHPISKEGGYAEGATKGQTKGHSHALPNIPMHDNRPAFQGMYYIIRVR